MVTKLGTPGKTICALRVVPVQREGLALVWADVERFDIEELLAADPAGGPLLQHRAFTVQIPELVSVGVHWHDYYELGHVLEGHATHVVNGVVQRAAPGTTFLLSPADFHSLDASESGGLRLLNAVLHPGLAERTLESVLPAGDLALPWSVPYLPGVAEDVRRICEEVPAGKPGWDVVVESALRAIVVELARAAAGPGARAVDP